MKIWIADFSFETTLKTKKVISDVVTVRIPTSHIHRKSDFLDRALRSLSITELKLLAKNKQGRYIVTINYTKLIGKSNG
jgi:hypothetical protein